MEARKEMCCAYTEDACTPHIDNRDISSRVMMQ